MTSTVLALASAALAAVIVHNRSAPSSDQQPAPDLEPAAVTSMLTFGDCQALLAYYRSHGLELVGPYGLPGDEVMLSDRATAQAPPATDSANESATGKSTTGESASDPSGGSANGTNVQVAGVDEADMSKLSDDLLVAVAGGQVTVSRLDGADTTLLARWSEPSYGPAQLLVDGRTVVVIGSIGGSRFQAAGTRLVQLDLSDPARPRPVHRLDLEGTVTGARSVDGVARFAVTSAPTGFDWQQPQPSYGSPGIAPSGEDAAFEAARERATAANRALIERSTAADWLPGYELSDYRGAGTPGAPVRQGQLVDCARVSAPDVFSGLNTLSLLTADLRDPAGLATATSSPTTGGGPVGVVASATTLYATATRTYLATDPRRALMTRAVDTKQAVPDSSTNVPDRTAIHVFDTTGRTDSRYVASGSVPGALINQFALDEYDGRLRVATTTAGTAVEPQTGTTAEAPAGTAVEPPIDDAPATPIPDRATRPVAQSQSEVDVLELRDRKLTLIGRVGGLGRGETIQSVRFIGPIGYVVTFRQTDPLFTIDLTDPARPRVAGELMLLGYSAYLHPVGARLLLGLGVDATEEGTATGLQLSLFDVSAVDRPNRVANTTMTGGWSEAQADHHAFTLVDGLVLVPFQRPVYRAGTDSGVTSDRVDATAGTDGVLAVRIIGNDLSAPTILASEGGVVRRTYVRDGYLYSVTDAGIGVHEVTGLTRVGFTRY